MDYKEKIESIKAQYRMPKEQRDEAIKILSFLEKAEQMPQEAIMAYAKKIRPLVRGTKENALLTPYNKNKTLFWAKPSKISTESFTFRADAALMKAEGLTEVCRIKSYHRYGGFYGCLRPSIEEAIVQCPKEWLDKVCAFEFQTDSDRFDAVYDYMLDRHVLRTIYYIGTLPEEIANLPVEW